MPIAAASEVSFVRHFTRIAKQLICVELGKRTSTPHHRGVVAFKHEQCAGCAHLYMYIHRSDFATSYILWPKSCMNSLASPSKYSFITMPAFKPSMSSLKSNVSAAPTPIARPGSDVQIQLELEIVANSPHIVSSAAHLTTASVTLFASPTGMLFCRS